MLALFVAISSENLEFHCADHQRFESMALGKGIYLICPRIRVLEMKCMDSTKVQLTVSEV
jgi:hypothetical protein